MFEYVQNDLKKVSVSSQITENVEAVEPTNERKKILAVPKLPKESADDILDCQVEEFLTIKGASNY